MGSRGSPEEGAQASVALAAHDEQLEVACLQLVAVKAVSLLLSFKRTEVLAERAHSRGKLCRYCNLLQVAATPHAREAFAQVLHTKSELGAMLALASTFSCYAAWPAVLRKPRLNF
jgi:hypothetical protein